MGGACSIPHRVRDPAHPAPVGQVRCCRGQQRTASREGDNPCGLRFRRVGHLNQRTEQWRSCRARSLRFEERDRDLEGSGADRGCGAPARNNNRKSGCGCGEAAQTCLLGGWGPSHARLLTEGRAETKGREFKGSESG